jgi:hypothetical protein
MTSFTEYKTMGEEWIPHAGTQYGSNEGGIHTHQPSNQKFYVKYPFKSEQAHVEAATADLYNEMGIRTLNPKTKEIHGRTAVVTPWQDGVKSMSHHSDYESAAKDPKRSLELARIHHGAVLTGNLDIVGLDYANVMKDQKSGELVSADQGGAMHFRAMGGSKDFPSDISKEMSGFKNPAYQSGQAFQHVHPEHFKEAAKSLLNLTDNKVDEIMSKHGLEKYSDVVKSRRNQLLDHYAIPKE